MLRLAYPKASDGELLERIFVGGICTVIDQFSTLSASSACRTSAAETPWTKDVHFRTWLKATIRANGTPSFGNPSTALVHGM